jgi:hypothetical protein
MEKLDRSDGKDSDYEALRREVLALRAEVDRLTDPRHARPSYLPPYRRSTWTPPNAHVPLVEGFDPHNGGSDG